MHDEAIAQAFGQEAGKTTAHEPVEEGGHMATGSKAARKRGGKKAPASPPAAPELSGNGTKPEDAPRRHFRGQRITKQSIALGTGGQIKFDRELPVRADVVFTARALFENVKYRFLDQGRCEEILILTVEADSFELLEVRERPKQEELLDEDNQPAAADDEPAATEEDVKELADAIGKPADEDDPQAEAAAL